MKTPPRVRAAFAFSKGQAGSGAKVLEAWSCATGSSPVWSTSKKADAGARRRPELC